MDWMKCCVSTDVGTWTNWLTFEPDLDHSPEAGTGLLSPIVYACTATQNFITSGKSHALVLGARRSSDAWLWGIETPLSEVNVLFRVHFYFYLGTVATIYTAWLAFYYGIFSQGDNNSACYHITCWLSTLDWYSLLEHFDSCLKIELFIELREIKVAVVSLDAWKLSAMYHSWCWQLSFGMSVSISHSLSLSGNLHRLLNFVYIDGL